MVTRPRSFWLKTPCLTHTSGISPLSSCQSCRLRAGQPSIYCGMHRRASGSHAQPRSKFLWLCVLTWKTALGWRRSGRDWFFERCVVSPMYRFFRSRVFKKKSILRLLQGSLCLKKNKAEFSFPSRRTNCYLGLQIIQPLKLLEPFILARVAHTVHLRLVSSPRRRYTQTQEGSLFHLHVRCLSSWSENH